jgi:hypothetical protein
VRILWALKCWKVTEDDDGLHILGANRGLYAFEDPPPAQIELPVVVCIEFEPGDGTDETEVSLAYLVRTPNNVPSEFRSVPLG